MIEEWRPVKGYEGHYEVSNLGMIKSIKFDREVTLRPRVCGKGYYTVSLWVSNKQVTIRIHVVVAVAFLDHEPNGMKIVVDHIDDNKLNNRSDNLQLLTNRQNLCKNGPKGSSKYMGVGRLKGRKRWSAAIKINSKSKYLGSFDTEIEASDAYQKALSELNSI